MRELLIVRQLAVKMLDRYAEQYARRDDEQYRTDKQGTCRS
jgi:hypothetical protein